MDFKTAFLAFIVSLSWNVGALLVKNGLYYTSPTTSMLTKGLIFFVISLFITIYYLIKKRKIITKDTVKGLKYFTFAVLFTFFIGSYSYLKMIENSEKLSLIVFIQSILVLFCVSVLSYFFLGERLNLTQIIGIVIGLIGTGIIVINTDIYKKN